MGLSFLDAERERPPAFVQGLVFLLLGPLVLFPQGLLATVLSQTSGKVYLRQSSAAPWALAARGRVLNGGDQVRTDANGRATITFDDESRVELGPNSTFAIQETNAKGSSSILGLGYLKAWVTKRVSQQFKIRTPTAVCSVRGTEFAVGVSPSGSTSVEMFQGVLAVADLKGNEALVKDGERIEVTNKGLGAVKSGGEQTRQDRARDALKREVGLEMSKEQVQAAAALEERNAVYKEGKSIIDVSGHRVRLEQYIIRSQPDQFKLVVLNDRSDRFDYFYYKGTFNATLPDDLSIAFRQLPGCIGAPCSYFMTGFETARSNTQDNMLEIASGGHLVDVNNNGYADDAVTSAFDPATNSYVSVSVPSLGLTGNQPFYKTLYNTDRLTFNGVEHSRFGPASGLASVTSGQTGLIALGCTVGQPCVQNTKDSASGGDTLYTLTTSLKSYPSCSPPDCTFNEAGVIHSVIYESNLDGTIWDKFDNYVISDEGKLATAADFAGVSFGGSDYKSTLLHWNYQTIVTASEFQGRKIDLVVSPKIFIESGIIP